MWSSSDLIHNSKHVVNVQKVEGLALLLVSVYSFHEAGAAWWIFGTLLLSIDISLIGYALNNKFGAYVYNSGHSLVAPLLLNVLGRANDNRGAIIFSTIWLAHIGMDRVLGYGLKHTSGFHDTHLGRIGKKRR